MADKKPETKTKPKLAVAKATDVQAAQAAVAKHAATGTTKPVKAKKDGVARETHDDRKITVLFKENPGRPGTKAHVTREQYKNDITVAQWREACRKNGGDPGYLAFDVKKGYVKLSDK